MAFVIAQYGHGGPDVMHAEEREIDHPAVGQVRLEQKAVGFNYFDVLQRKGLLSGEASGRVMGIEAAGVVTAIGPDVSDFAVGDRVAYLRSQGAYADERLIDASLLFPLPEDISFDAAAALTVKGFMAWLCGVRLFRIERGQTILVTTAAGGVGSLITRLAAHTGARVIGMVGSHAKRAAVQESGAVEVAVGLPDAIAVVDRLTDGGGVDAVFDGIGANTAEQLVGGGTVRDGGTVISFGASGGWPASDKEAMARQGVTVLTPQALDYLKDAAELRQSMKQVFALQQSGAFGTIPLTIYPLLGAIQLHEDVESRVNSGVMVLRP